MIYYYTELRSEIKKAAKELAKKNKLSIDEEESSDLCVLRNACRQVSIWGKAIESEAPEATNGVNALKKFRTSVAQLNALAEKFGLDHGDIEVFKTVSPVVH